MLGKPLHALYMDAGTLLLSSATLLSSIKNRIKMYIMRSILKILLYQSSDYNYLKKKPPATHIFCTNNIKIALQTRN
jgi:hypothetical protein